MHVGPFAKVVLQVLLCFVDSLGSFFDLCKVVFESLLFLPLEFLVFERSLLTFSVLFFSKSLEFFLGFASLFIDILKVLIEFIDFVNKALFSLLCFFNFSLFGSFINFLEILFSDFYHCLLMSFLSFKSP